MSPPSIKNLNEKAHVNELLDKLILKQLQLMEYRMVCELNIETSINNGTIDLAKSRYIMGQSSVSATCLPTETSNEFSASALCETIETDGARQLKVVENNADDAVNPMKWFGVLVPQNLHRAQSIFKHAVDYVVECVNIQLELEDIMDKRKILKIWNQQN